MTRQSALWGLYRFESCRVHVWHQTDDLLVEWKSETRCPEGGAPAAPRKLLKLLVRLGDIEGILKITLLLILV